MNSKVDELITKLAYTRTDENLFNPYNQVCKHDDITTAPGVRQGNLRLYLDKYTETKTDIIWLYDYADYYSAKKSGVPLVEPPNYKNIETILGLPAHFENANKNTGIVNTGKSHSKTWDRLAAQALRPLIWNILPFYPHNLEDIVVEREPAPSEYEKYSEYLYLLVDIFRPRVVVASNKRVKTMIQLLGLKAKSLVLK